MTYNIIATGSAGNAVIINDSILIDIGVPWKLIEPYAGKIRLVLLTHEHGDHFRPSTVRALHKQHPATRWGCCEWMVGPLLEAGVRVNAIDLFPPQGLVYSALDVIVRAQEIPHNVRNCCYHITTADGDGERIFYATDCSNLSGIEAKGFDLYMVEGNFQEAEIEARIAAKRAAGEFAYEVEASKNHLSQEQALDWLAANMWPRSQYVFLHQHQEKRYGEKSLVCDGLPGTHTPENSGAGGSAEH